MNAPKNRAPSLELGKISGVVGLKGGLRFISYNPHSDLLAKIKQVSFDHPQQGRAMVSVQRCEKRKAFSALFVAEISSIATAEAWVGATVTADIAALRLQGLIAEDEFFYDEAIGFEVWIAGEPQSLGEVAGFFPLNGDAQAPMVCVVKLAQAPHAEVLLPCHADLLVSCDRVLRRLTFGALAMDLKIS